VGGRDTTNAAVKLRRYWDQVQMSRATFSTTRVTRVSNLIGSCRISEALAHCSLVLDRADRQQKPTACAGDLDARRPCC
jgi:hypothetical protein